MKPEAFPALALEVFHYQYQFNTIYAQFVDLLQIDPREVRQTADIPFLPIALFKQFQLQSGLWEPVKVFTSSGTTGATTSRHLLRDQTWYTSNARRTFELQYGSLTDFTVLALLPAYLEREGSSLVFMADDFIKASGRVESGFYLDNLDALQQVLRAEVARGRKVLLLGVSFALLDLAERNTLPLGKTVFVMETGGMKGRRKEIPRSELHTTISAGLGIEIVHSEYGMTELLSQAYAPRDGIFIPAPTMQVLSRDVMDPLTIRKDARTGALNIIDLANLDTISFIATDDLGKVFSDGTFTVLGRMDASDTRGCNLLVS